MMLLRKESPRHSRFIGIGLATIETFARRGATVALNCLPTDTRGVSEIIDQFKLM
jgi:NAD(P)-dependent dehydrogenase (short-subunit alcohol dehydrogenase family)